MSKIIVIAPHADDEVLGCGATIARHVSEGDQVMVIIATNASLGAPELFNKNDISKIRSEALEAHKILGIHDTVFRDFPAPALDVFPGYKISLALTEIFKTFNPNVLYLPHPGDLHQDHKAIYSAALVAARPQGNLKISTILCYETLSETEWAPHQGLNAFIPAHFVDVSNFFELKLESIKCYKSQLKTFPHSRSLESIKALATYRGASVGLLMAEAFEVERQII